MLNRKMFPDNTINKLMKRSCLLEDNINGFRLAVAHRHEAPLTEVDVSASLRRFSCRTLI